MSRPPRSPPEQLPTSPPSLCRQHVTYLPPTGATLSRIALFSGLAGLAAIALTRHTVPRVHRARVAVPATAAATVLMAAGFAGCLLADSRIEPRPLQPVCSTSEPVVCLDRAFADQLHDTTGSFESVVARGGASLLMNKSKLTQQGVVTSGSGRSVMVGDLHVSGTAPKFQLPGLSPGQLTAYRYLESLLDPDSCLGAPDHRMVERSRQVLLYLVGMYESQISAAYPETADLSALPPEVVSEWIMANRAALLGCSLDLGQYP